MISIIVKWTSGKINDKIALLSVFIKSILPFLLSFAAGCMISVAGRELLPEASKEHKNYATIGLVFGFVLMMALETIFEI